MIGTGAGADSGAWAARGSCSSRAPWPDGRLRRRRLEGPATRSGFAAGAGGAATAGGSGSVDPLDPRRRRRRRGGPAGPGGVGASTPASVPCAFVRPAASRLTFAPTSPSAQSAPSTVWTSTRQTTMAEVAPPTGGRFWVRVQRAKMVSPAWMGRGNFQFSHSQASTEGTGISMEPRPTLGKGRRKRAAPDRAEYSPRSSVN